MGLATSQQKLKKINGGATTGIKQPFTVPGTGLPTIGGATLGLGTTNSLWVPPVPTDGGQESGGIPTDTGSIAGIAQTAEQLQAAADNGLRGRGNATLDELLGLYDEIMSRIKTAGGDQTNRLNKQYDGKDAENIDAMNSGMYDVDASAAASNLADSSFRSFDRTKVRKAAESNGKILDDARNTDLAKVGAMVTEDTAKYQADKDGVALTRDLLGKTTGSELTSSVNNLDATKRGVQANRAKYGTEGEFVQAANKIGNYDTSTLEKTMQAVVDNASATPATKQATMDDLLNGTGLSADKKAELKNKYTQVIG